MKNKTKYILILILALIAIGNSFYLAYEWFFPVQNIINPYVQIGNIVEDGGKFCDINTLFSCSKVINSSVSNLFGIPFSVYGIGFFILIFVLSVISLINNKKDNLKNIFFITGGGVLFNFYLFYLEIFVIKAFCPVCIAISISLFSIFFISLFHTLKCTTKQ